MIEILTREKCLHPRVSSDFSRPWILIELDLVGAIPKFFGSSGSPFETGKSSRKVTRFQHGHVIKSLFSVPQQCI
jgi:hypothetical protein